LAENIPQTANLELENETEKDPLPPEGAAHAVPSGGSRERQQYRSTTQPKPLKTKEIFAVLKYLPI
jgi:hypothetical protein